MQKKNFVMVLLSMFLLLSLASTVEAVTLITFPTGGSIVRNQSLGVFMETTGAMSECRLRVNDATLSGFGATNTTSTFIGNGSVTNITNSTATQTNFTFTINTNAIEDGHNYNFSVECTNSTVPGNPLNLTETSSVSNVIVDNTIPNIATGLTTSVSSSNPTLTATAIDKNTTQCRVVWTGKSPISGNNPVYALASGTCSFTLTNAVDGTFGYRVVTSDGSNETNSAEASLKIDARRDENGAPVIKESQQEAGKSAVGEASAGFMGKLSSLFSNIASFFKGLFS